MPKIDSRTHKVDIAAIREPVSGQVAERPRAQARSAMPSGSTQFGVNLTRSSRARPRRCATGTSRRTNSSTCSKASWC